MANNPDDLIYRSQVDGRTYPDVSGGRVIQRGPANMPHAISPEQGAAGGVEALPANGNIVSPPGAREAQQRYGIPAPIRQREPWATLTGMVQPRVGGGYSVTTLTGFPSPYPHVLSQVPDDPFAIAMGLMRPFMWQPQRRGPAPAAAPARTGNGNGNANSAKKQAAPPAKQEDKKPEEKPTQPAPPAPPGSAPMLRPSLLDDSTAGIDQDAAPWWQPGRMNQTLPTPTVPGSGEKDVGVHKAINTQNLYDAGKLAALSQASFDYKWNAARRGMPNAWSAPMSKVLKYLRDKGVALGNDADAILQWDAQRGGYTRPDVGVDARHTPQTSLEYELDKGR